MPEAGRIHGSRRNRKHEQMDDGDEIFLGGSHAGRSQPQRLLISENIPRSISRLTLGNIVGPRLSWVCPECLSYDEKLKRKSTKLLTHRSAFIHDVSCLHPARQRRPSGALERLWYRRAKTQPS